MREIRNLNTDPNCLRELGTFNATCTGADGDGHYSYRRNDGVPYGAVWRFSRDIPVGDVLLAAWRVPADTNLLIGATTGSQIFDLPDGIRAYVGTIANTSNHDARFYCEEATLVAAAHFTAQDWEEVYRLYQSGILAQPWFSGDSFPKNN